MASNFSNTPTSDHTSRLSSCHEGDASVQKRGVDRGGDEGVDVVGGYAWEEMGDDSE